MKIKSKENKVESPKSVKSKIYTRDKVRFLVSFFALFALWTFSFLLSTPAHAATGINKQINFQGKLVDNNGLNVANNTYTVVFSLYSVASGGTAIWTETQNVTTANGDGIFQVQLGSVTSLPGSVDFNTDNLYLGIKVNADAEMTPRVRFTAVPYAFNADKVHGLNVTDTTGTFTLAAAKTLTVSNTLTLAGTDGKTLTLNGNTTLADNAITFGGGENLTLAATKSVVFADEFNTVGAFAITLTSTGITNVTLPTTGTLATLAGTETFTNKTIGSTGLIFSGAATDITTGTNEDLVIMPNGTGNVGIGTTLPGAKLDIAAGTGLTTSGGLNVSGTFDHSAAQTGSLAALSFTEATNLNGSNATTTNGLLISPTINVTGGGSAAGVKTINALKIAAPTLTACSGGTNTCVYTGLNIDTSGTLANTTKYAALFNGGNVGVGTTSPNAKLDVSTGTGLTTTIGFNVSGFYTHAAAETGSLSTIVFTDSSTNTSGTSSTNGLAIASTFATSGAGTKDINDIKVGPPIISACATGACNWDGIEINTQTSSNALLTQNGINLITTGTSSAGSLTGINIGNITTGAATETALTIGSGWDRDIYLSDASPNITIADGGNTFNISDTAGSQLLALTDGGTQGQLLTGSLYLNTGNISTCCGTNFTLAGDTAGVDATQLVLPVKTDSGDPTTTQANGGMYYNSNSGKFRCYEGSTWKDCISATATWSSLAAPTANLSMNMYQSVGTSFNTTFTYGNATSTTNLFNLTDTASNTGTGYLMNITTASSSTLKPFHVSAAGTEALTVLANGNVGIGTTIPGYKLEVESATAVQAIFQSTGANRAGIIIDNVAGSQQSVILLTDAGVEKYQIGKNTDNSFFFYDNTNSRDFLRETTSGNLLLQPVGGSVGIGNTNPQELLHLTQSSGATGTNIRLDSSDTDIQSGEFLGALDFYSSVDHSGAKARIRAIAEGQFTGTDSYTGLAFYTNRADGSINERLRIDNNGNVGIGTTSPSGLLDISKALSAAPSAIGKYLSISASTLTDSSTAGSGTATQNVFNSIAQPTLAASNTGVTTTNTSTFYIAGGPTAGTNQTITNSYGIRIASGTISGVTNGYGLSVEAPTGATNNYAAIFSGGNVGIGTTAPSFTLDTEVTGGGFAINAATSFGASGNAGGSFIGRGAQGTQGSPTASLSGDNLAVFGGRGYGATGFSSSSRGVFGVYAAENWDNSSQGAYLTLETTPLGSSTRQESVRITPAGNVGIGTTGPNTALDVNGYITSRSLNTANALVYTDSTGKFLNAANGGAGTFCLVQTDGGVPTFSSCSGTNSSIWSQLGNPSASLTLNHAANTTTMTFNSVTTGTAWTQSSSSLSSGSLLSLSVNSTAAASNTQKALNISTQGTNSTSTQTTYGGYFSNTHTGTSSTNVALYSTASGGTNNYAGIFETGFVGIGTTAPTGVLHVVGSQPASVSGTPATAATGVLTVLGGTGGDTTNTGTAVGGIGGALSLTGGTGGLANSALTSDTGGKGGAITLTSGTGGAAAATLGTKTGGAGGDFSILGGTGGAASGVGTNIGGAGGAIYVTGGAGGTGGTPGADGNVLLAVTSGGTARGSVGIGKTNPGTALDVNGTVTATGLALGSGTITGAGLADCDTSVQKLGWDSSTSKFTCISNFPDTASFADTNPAAIADNDTTKLFNDATEPNITPTSTSQTVMVSVTARFTGGGTQDTVAAVKIYRNVGSAATCNTSTLVGSSFSTFMTNTTDIMTATATFLDSPATTSQTFYAVCSSSDSSLGANPTSNRIDVTLVTLGADLAENYYTTDASIEPGNIVSIDSSLPAGAKKSAKSYDSTVLGIVSTQPGHVLDDGIGRDHGRAVPVALSGRVPVKVTSEAGPIKPGDYITASSIPGVGMRATQAGQVVAQAMTGFDGQGVGLVFAFVHKGYNEPQNLLAGLTLDDYGNLILPDTSTPEDEISALGGTLPAAPKKDLAWTLSDIVRRITKLEERNVIASGSAAISNNNATDSTQLDALNSDVSLLKSTQDGLKEKVASLEATLALLNPTPYSPTPSASDSAALGLESISATDGAFSGTLNVAGRTVLTDVGITGQINAGLLNIIGLDTEGNASINTTAGPLKLQSDGFNGVDILNGKIVIDTKGNMKVDGTVTVKKINVDTQDVAGASVGTAVIPTGTLSVDVNTSSLTPKSKIFVTAEEPVAIGAKAKDSNSIIIKLTAPYTSDLKVNWWIVN